MTKEKRKKLTEWDKGIAKIRRDIENRITDKMRLDWIHKHQLAIYQDGVAWEIYFNDKCYSYDTPRQAIDAAMRAAMKARKP